MKHLNIEEAIKALKNPSYEPSVNNEKHKNNKKFAILARQLTGQPAGEFPDIVLELGEFSGADELDSLGGIEHGIGALQYRNTQPG